MSAHRDGLHTLGRWTSDRALVTPGRIAIDDRGVRLSYLDLEGRAAALATSLLRSGYRPGDRIATLAGNGADQVVLFFACAKAGFVLAPLSWRLAAAELADQLATADPALLVIEDEFEVLARAALELVLKRPAVSAMGPGGVEGMVPAPAARSLEQEVPLARRGVQDDDPLLMLFTSGTEGRAKAVVLTHANCFWNNMALSRTLDLTSHDTVLAVLPQYHAGGWNIQPLLAWWTGATVVLERTFDAGRVLQLIADRRVTTMMGVPTHYRMLATDRAFKTTDLSTLRLAVVGGAPMPSALLRCWHARGVSLVQGYGLTEAGPNVLCLVGEDAMSKGGYAGKPYPHVEVRIVDPASGLPLDGAGRGELMVTGPSVFAGYFRDPEATARVLVGGWLRTGDMVERDAEGYIKVVDRLKDIYISGGENISPTEVEQVLEAHPAVADVAVLGVPDPRWGEVGEAYVVLRPGAHADAEDLAGHCAPRLARFKIPARFHFVPELPRTGLEKISRTRLRALSTKAPETYTQTGNTP
ncbi:MAG: AMP-binding protein [Paeniglutamicibacter sp.]